ncbi:glycosyltransferase family 4 protein [Rugosimonospora africana]|uniref:glycosyltransferase family 4 protein n=1 Tax=Rugosimonospora africana TaxID=556532 RepID=UPI001941F9BC|nr:glycosyltransferase family 4 protein [Rugosimonospora africana]
MHVVLPNDIDDPATPSGGNAYDRRICDGLAGAGWSVAEHAVPGTWPRPDAAQRGRLAGVLAALPDGATVLIDGLIASTVPEELVGEAGRLGLVVLVHMALADESADLADAERVALSAATAIIATSAWARQRLLDLYGLPADRVHVATPGVEAAPLTASTDAGTRLLCVAAVAPHKGHDVLTEALATVADLSWSCVCAGSLTRDPGFVQRLRRRARTCGLTERLRFVGPRTGGELDATYAAADLLVLASRGETYGMVVTEALARGIPVLATAANGLPEALGRAPDGSLPGMLVRPDDRTALAGALRRWLDDADLRHRLRRSARQRRTTLSGWATTSDRIATVLSGVAA